MSAKRDLNRIDDILKCIEVIERHIQGKSLHDFEQDDMLQGGIQFQFLIIGEAVGSISYKRLEQYPFPWYLPKSFRNFIIHEYHQVKLERIYNACFSLSELKTICLSMKKDMTK